MCVGGGGVEGNLNFLVSAWLTSGTCPGLVTLPEEAVLGLLVPIWLLFFSGDDSYGYRLTRR